MSKVLNFDNHLYINVYTTLDSEVVRQTLDFNVDLMSSKWTFILEV